MKEILNPSPILGPVPVVLVSVGDMENANITTVAWTGIINSDPSMLYISLRKTRYSYDIINNRKEFVINIPSDNLVYEVDFCGTKSGKDIDKFAECKFNKIQSKNVLAPSIAECPINLECKVREIKSLGSHDMFISDIVSTSVNKEILTETKRIDYEKARILTYADGNYFVNDKIIAKRGICLK